MDFTFSSGDSESCVCVGVDGKQDLVFRRG
jgi:hypothetical protein